MGSEVGKTSVERMGISNAGIFVFLVMLMSRRNSDIVKCNWNKGIEAVMV